MRICAVVVTFNPEGDIGSRLRAVRGQTAATIVVDNATNSRATLAAAVEAEGCEWVGLASNVGIAAALNVGLDHARRAGFEWVVTFDQDSIPHDHYLDRLVAALTAHAERTRTALLGGNPIDARTGKTPYPDTTIAAAVPAEMIISSGTLMNLAACAEVGPFREEFFIDGVDQDYCLRARAAGWLVLVVPAATFSHSLGDVRPCRLFGREVLPTAHSPIRRYYMTRNTLVLAAEHVWKQPRWTFGRLIALAKGTLLCLLCEDGRARKLGYALLGVRDAISGRLGVRPATGAGRKPMGHA